MMTPIKKQLNYRGGFLFLEYNVVNFIAIVNLVKSFSQWVKPALWCKPAFGSSIFPLFYVFCNFSSNSVLLHVNPHKTLENVHTKITFCFWITLQYIQPWLLSRLEGVSNSSRHSFKPQFKSRLGHVYGTVAGIN